MNARTAWDNLSHAISDMQSAEGDHDFKLRTVLAAVQLLFEFSAREILEQVERSPVSPRALVSWLVFEGGRIPGVDQTVVQALRELYEASSPPGQGIIPPPPSMARPGHG